MMRTRLMRLATLAASGAMVFQAAGCAGSDLGGLVDSFFASPVLDVVQTIFLGISAAGGFAILQNI